MTDMQRSVRLVEPQAGEHVHITLPAVLDEDGDYVIRRIIRDEDGDQIDTACVFPEDVVNVESVPRPFPTEHGALILARVPGYSVGPLLLELGLHNGRPVWFPAGAQGATPIHESAIAPGWRLVDGATLRTEDGW